MLQEDLIQNSRLTPEVSTTFLLIQGLTPYLNRAQRGTVLDSLGVACPASQWDPETVESVCSAYAQADRLFTKGGRIRPGIAHTITCEAVTRDDLVSVVLGFCSTLEPHLAAKNLIYLAFYQKSVLSDSRFRKLTDLQLRVSVMQQYLAEADLTLEWLHGADHMRIEIMRQSLQDLFFNATVWKGIESILAWVGEYYTTPPASLSDDDINILFLYGHALILRGQDIRETTFWKALHPRIQMIFEGFQQIMQGQSAEGVATLRQLAQLWAGAIHLQSAYFLPDITGVVLYVARFLSRTDFDTLVQDCSIVFRRVRNNDELLAYQALHALHFRKFHPDQDHDLSDLYERAKKRLESASIFTRILYLYIAVPDRHDDAVRLCTELRERYRQVLPIVAHLLNDVLKDVEKGCTDLPEIPYGPWIDIAHPVPLWELQLQKLSDVLTSQEKEASQEKERRLAWLVDPDELTVNPVVQVRNSRGNWSAGQKYALKRLASDESPYITDQDRQMSFAFTEAYSYYGLGTRFDAIKGFRTLVGHPYLFDSETREHYSLVEKPVELCVKEQDNLCSVTLSARPDDGSSIVVKKIEPHVWGLYVFTPKASAVLHVLGDNGIKLPSDKLTNLLNMVGNDTMPLNVQTSSPHREGVSTPVVQLWQQGNAFQAALRVRPSGTENGTAFPPATGSEDVLQIEENRPVIIERDFEAETKAAEALMNGCPALASMDPNWDWYSTEIGEFFQLITELKETTIPCRMEWPSGEKFRLAGRINRSQISIHTRKSSGNWFALSGEVHVDEEQVIQLTELLERSSGMSNRFVQLKNGDFLALSDDVKKSLEKLRLYSSRKKGNERQVHPLAGALIEDVCQDMQQDSDTSWNDMIHGMRKAFELKPEVPLTLKAELRPYQLQGFVWLSRLAEWGVGGCLADDMGLGKTIQSIAVMLREAQKGPCLIIAPTSVCPNWEDELNRFAPSLQVVHLKEAANRQKMVKGMTKGMVMITGYGLLPRVQEMLASHQWQMVVFDEAQALKNSTTKRSRAAGSIPASFHLALTGTPIENRLEDLWSVFDIINPGLLGTLSDFHRRFVGAEQGGPAAQALKMLIRPFILRRLKSQVLDDLPELTEQTIIIEPTEKEAAFYESLRRRALEHVSDDSAPQTKGQKRFNILTELTRLRRACCHASLADPNVGTLVEPVSSKLQRFLELLDEARSGGHRLLVFSQFTGHLALVRKELDERQIPYQYLDGSTPEDKRRESVAAFQRGEGDLFLISLKAGGQGLNLTAADYVVHLDPWWNPAVEDQATDRAHRIGQKKTVTVYRLVMAHSVEEKILKLHTQKRDLAADFLEGHEEAVTQATLSEEELLALLQ